jgi:hypothetical protein
MLIQPATAAFFQADWPQYAMSAIDFKPVCPDGADVLCTVLTSG